MTDLQVGVVDVFVLSGAGSTLRVLALHRAEGTRCTGAWEVVHGRVEPGERPEEAAIREVGEETGLVVERLYNVTCQMFYLHRESTVQVAVVFAAFVTSLEPLALGVEHDEFDWWTVQEASSRLSWPRSRATLREAAALVGSGDAGAVEDVLRVM